MICKKLNLAVLVALGLAALVPIGASAEVNGNNTAPGSPGSNLVYSPPAGQTDSRDLKVVITEVLLGGAPTGFNGFANGTLQLQVQAADLATGQTVIQTALCSVSSEIAGRKMAQVPSPPYFLRLDRQAQLLALSSSDLPAPPAAPALPLGPGQGMLETILAQGAGELISQGGVPLQALAIQCAFPPLPDHAVQTGDTWQLKYSADFPGGGKLEEQCTTTLQSLDANTARFSSAFRYTLPEFEASNPLLPGSKMKVRNAVLEVKDLIQEYDLAKSLVRQAHGKMSVALDATSPGMNLPIKITAEITYGPTG